MKPLSHLPQPSLEEMLSRSWRATALLVLGGLFCSGFAFDAHASILGDFLGFFTGSSFYCADDLPGVGGFFDFFGVSTPVGSLYDNGISECNPLGVTRIFSGFVCEFEHLASEIFGTMYCSIQQYLQRPLQIMLMLFTIFIGIAFLTSYIQFSAKEVSLIMIKMILVLVFATRSDMMITYLFNGFMGFMQASVFTVLKTFGRNDPLAFFNQSIDMQYFGSLSGLFGKMDEIIADIIQNSIGYSMVDIRDPATGAVIGRAPSFAGGDCQSDPLKVLMTVAIAMPPLFMVLLMTVIKLLMVFIRTLLGYLLSIVGVMFLLTLAPIFLSLGLFRITKSFFDAWLSMLVGFATEVFIMFAFLAMALLLITNSQFADYGSLVRNYGQELTHDSIRFGVVDSQLMCSFCEIDQSSLSISFSRGDAPRCATPERVIPPSALYSEHSIIQFLASKIFLLALVAYLFESILTLAPVIAAGLSKGVGVMGSSRNAPSIGTYGVSPIPGKGHLQAGKQAMRQVAESGEGGVAGVLRTMLGLRS